MPCSEVNRHHLQPRHLNRRSSSACVAATPCRGELLPGGLTGGGRVMLRSAWIDLAHDVPRRPDADRRRHGPDPKSAPMPNGRWYSSWRNAHRAVRADRGCLPARAQGRRGPGGRTADQRSRLAGWVICRRDARTAWGPSWWHTISPRRHHRLSRPPRGRVLSPMSAGRPPTPRSWPAARASRGGGAASHRHLVGTTSW